MTVNMGKSEPCAKLRAVVALGVATGVWSVLKITAPDEGAYWLWADVVTPDGLVFTLSTSMGAKLCASVASLRSECGVSVAPRDVLPCGVTVPEARVSADKTPDKLLHDIQRRVLANPDCLSAATALRERLTTLLASKSRLSAHRAALADMGFALGTSRPAETYVTDARHKLLGNVKVYEDGRVSFGCSTDIATLPAVLALLARNTFTGD